MTYDFIYQAAQTLEDGEAMHLLVAAYPGDRAAIYFEDIPTMAHLKWFRGQINEVLDHIEAELKAEEA